MCLSCGHDGSAIQSENRESTWFCPGCGTDLYARPPRSYADLEGLIESPNTSAGPSRSQAPLDQAVLSRDESSMARRALARRTSLSLVCAVVFGTLIIGAVVASGMLAMQP